MTPFRGRGAVMPTILSWPLPVSLAGRASLVARSDVDLMDLGVHADVHLARSRRPATYQGVQQRHDQIALLNHCGATQCKLTLFSP